MIARMILTTLVMATCAAGYSNWARAQQTQPQDMEPLFQLNPTDAADLSIQSRRYDNGDYQAVLNAGSSVLQDMGFKITGGERELGLLTGEKMADVTGAGPVHAIGEAALVTATLILSVMAGQDMVMNLPEQVAQRIHVSLLVTPDSGPTPGATTVRLSIDRDMIYDHGGVIADHTELPLVYQEFFGKLSKSVYLEGERL